MYLKAIIWVVQKKWIIGIFLILLFVTIEDRNKLMVSNIYTKMLKVDYGRI